MHEEDELPNDGNWYGKSNEMQYDEMHEENEMPNDGLQNGKSNDGLQYDEWNEISREWLQYDEAKKDV